MVKSLYLIIGSCLFVAVLVIYALSSMPGSATIMSGTQSIQNFTHIDTVESGEKGIRINEPKKDAHVSSPIRITGEARGQWFFEASFPIILENSLGDEISLGIAEATAEWMTEAFVPFEGEIVATGAHGPHTLVLMKDNPSGDPALDVQVRIPINLQ